MIVTSVLAAYLIGAIPFSYIIGRLLKGIDIRDYGSGNVGATNIMRTVGKVPGIIALLLDVSKGALAAAVIPLLFYNPGMQISEPFFKVILGLVAVCGHIWTIFLRFKGGKGVATSIGVFLGLAPFVTASGLIVWLILAGIFRYVSLSSIAMAISLPIFMLLYKRPVEYTILSVVLCVFIIYKHKANISRLLQGKEYRIGQKTEN